MRLFLRVFDFYFFSSHLIPSQPLVITPLFNPSTLLCYPYLLFTRFPRGMWLIPHRHFVHRAKLTRKIEGRARCGSSGSRGGQRRALKHSHMLKTAQGEKKGGKYGLLHHLFVSTKQKLMIRWTGLGRGKNYFCNFLLVLFLRLRSINTDSGSMFVESYFFFLPVRSLGEKSEALR